MKLALIPLDERPCNAYFPTALGKAAGLEVLTPPPSALGNKREAGDFEVLDNWLLEVAADLDGVIISVETLVYGGLIPSRISNTELTKCLERLETLRKLKDKFPDLAIYAFNIVMRISNSNNNQEEPLYWSEYGKLIWLYSRLHYRVNFLDMKEEEAELKTVENQIPKDILADYLERRERNHQINLAMVDLASEGVVDFLLFTQDDTSEFGFPNKEQYLLRQKISELGLENKVLVYPGADEVGMVLVARHLNRIHNAQPRFFTRYSSTKGPLLVANFEDRPLAETVKGQIFGAGGILVDTPSDADIILFLNTPGEKQGDSYIVIDDRTVDTTGRNLLEFVQAIKMYQDKGFTTALADVAYSNGADRKLIPLLERQTDLTKLDAFGGWNTAGNTLGTVVAHAIARHIAKEQGLTPAMERAHLEFLLLRFTDDWAHQAVVRTEVAEKLWREKGINAHELGEHWREAESLVREGLEKVMDEFFKRNFLGKRTATNGELSSLTLKNIHFPWQRIFEIGCEVSLNVKDG